MWFVSIRTQQKYKFVINFDFGKETRKKTDVFVHKNMDVMFNEPRIYDLQTFTTLKKTVYCTSTYVGFDATSPLTAGPTSIMYKREKS